jgi:hypothetical protein
MRLCRIQTLAMVILVGGVLLQNGCGGSGANTVVDTVSPPTATVVAGTVSTFTSTVTGSDTLTSTWSCTYVYTPNPTTSQPSPAQQGPFNCTSGQKVSALNNGSLGTWTITPSSTNSVLTYTAPTLSDMPNPIPTITFTAVADANKSKKGTAVITLDSGIRTAITPATATVPTEITPNQQVLFTADFLNVSPASANAQWKVVQPVSGNTTDFPDGTTPEPQDVSCSPNCGTISAQGVYTAPAKQPTNTSPVGAGSQASTLAPTVYVVCWAAADIDHYAIATITLVPASTNPLTFTGISPSTIPVGGALQDVWLNANNLLNTTPITFTPPGGSPQVIPSSNIFTIPITAAYCTPSASGVTPVISCNASIVTRIRLTAQQLTTPGTGTITVKNIPNGSGGTKSISYPINLVYASPALVGAVPDSFPQGTSTDFSADGGYFGSSNSPLVQLLFNGQLNLNVGTSNPRQITGYLPGSTALNSPGLYPVSVVSTSVPSLTPPPYPTVSTNVAVQPLFAGLSTAYFTTGTTTTPAVQIQNPPNIAFPSVGGVTNVAPSSIAVNSAKGYAAITEQGANAVQIVNFVSNPSVSGRYMPQMGIQIPVGSQPTSIAIDNQINLTNYPGQDLGVVVNSADYTLTLLALPSGQVIGSPISLKGLVLGGQNSSTALPPPYAVGVDPTTHYAVVAFSNAFVGYVVDVNPNPSTVQPPCFVSSQKVPCALAAVSMNTGTTPQVIMQPDVPLAYVTPGQLGASSGVTSVVNLLLTNNTVAIAAAPNGVSIGTNCVVTITTPVANGLNQSSPGSVLISGATPSSIDGTFDVTSATTYTFTYNYPLTTCPSSTQTGGGGSVTFGNPYYTFAVSSTATGGAINPVTRMFAFADPSASTSSPQLGFISYLDQSVSSLYLTRGSCNTCAPIPSGAPEVGLRSVAWDPFSDVLVAYNPANNYNEISLINPGGIAATGGAAAPYRIIQAVSTGQTGTGSFTPPGSSTPVTVYGPMNYDPKTNLVLVANAGSNTLTYLDIDPTTTFKPVSIQDILVTSGGVASAQPPLAGAPNAPSPLPKAVCDPANPTNIYASCFPQAVTVGQSATLRILGQGFTSGGNPIVRLDGDPTGVTVTNASYTEVDVTIAASRLTRAHDFALDVISGSVGSNTDDLYATGVITLSSLCSSAVMPEAVAVDNEANVAAFTSYGCNTLSFVSLDASNAHNYGVPYGALLATVKVGKNPIGVDMIPRLGYAVVANYGDSSASIIQYGGSPFTASQISFASASCVSGVSTTNLCTGLSPVGVAIDQDRALALVANNGGNSISAIDLTPLLTTQHTGACTPGACMSTLVATSGPPTAVAVDPDSAIAVVTNIQNAGTTSVTGGLDVINLATTPPSKTTTASISSLTANPTGIVYDPVPSPPLFYATSTQQNAIYTFDPSSGTTNLIRVGVNPYSIAYNYQTGTLVSINSTSNTSSVVDAVNAPAFVTRATLGISSQSQFAVALDQFTNTAIVVDQNNDRVLLMPMPK